MLLKFHHSPFSAFFLAGSRSSSLTRTPETDVSWASGPGVRSVFAQVREGAVGGLGGRGHEVQNVAEQLVPWANAEGPAAMETGPAEEVHGRRAEAAG